MTLLIGSWTIGLILAIYVVLSLAQPGQLKLP